jgi:predicted nucleotidyltransferase
MCEIREAIEPAILKAVRYADYYHFPLTAKEIWYWFPHVSPDSPDSPPFRKALLTLVSHGSLEKHSQYFTLPGRSSIIQIRRQRFLLSRHKWLIARRVVKSLCRIPTVQLVALTGSLAMNNSKENDDIDLMIVTYPNTLWFTRFLVVIILKMLHLRRPVLIANMDKIKDKICDNLYLESSRMAVTRSTGDCFYLAHELLQAKPIFDRKGVYRAFLSSNSWASNLLPNAYHHAVSTYTYLPRESRHRREKWGNYIYKLVSPVNFLFFVLQYLYMKPKMTGESVSLHTAYFHPKRALDKDPAPSLK